MSCKIDWARRIVGSKFTVFALFYFVFEVNFPSTSPWGAYIWRVNLTEGFFHYWIGGLIHGGAYFRNFTVICQNEVSGYNCDDVRVKKKKTRVGTLYYIYIYISHTTERKLQNNEPLPNENSGQKKTFFTPVI